MLATLVLVFIGGAAGVTMRALIVVNAREASQELWLLLGINTVGSFLLGMLAGWLANSPATARTHRLRSLLGTGLLGGFTSYSALAVLTTELGANNFMGAAAYGIGSLVAGIVAAWFGISLAQRTQRTTSEGEGEQ